MIHITDLEARLTGTSPGTSFDTINILRAFVCFYEIGPVRSIMSWKSLICHIPTERTDNLVHIYTLFSLSAFTAWPSPSIHNHYAPPVNHLSSEVWEQYLSFEPALIKNISFPTNVNSGFRIPCHKFLS